jgi:phosphatidylglycerophosphatase A
LENPLKNFSDIRDSFLKFFATVGPFGYSPVIPGTVGSLVSFGFYISLKPSASTLSILIIVLFFIGTVASKRYGELYNEEDSPRIVVDEFVGYLVSVVYLPYNLKTAFFAFLLFRVFDIIKPPPITQVERSLKGGLGVMADDIVAGAMVNLLMRLLS